MTDFQQQTPAPESSVTQSPEAPATPLIKKSNRNRFLIIGGMLLVICVCAVICIAAGGVGLFQINKEKAPLESVLDSFMLAMVARDTDKAFDLFSIRAQRQLSIDDMNEMLEGNNSVLFEGYQSLELQNIKISKAVNTNQNLPQGTVANVNGIIYYDSDFTGTFTAVLEKEGDNWRLHNINVTVPPNKIAP